MQSRYILHPNISALLHRCHFPCDIPIFQLFAIYDTITKNKLRYKKEIGVSEKYYHRESLNHKSAVASL